MSDYIEAQGSKEERRDLLKFHLGTASFGSPDEQAVRELLADHEAAHATIATLKDALEAANAELRKDAERIKMLQECQANHDWWVKRGTELEARMLVMQSALIRLRDCDWIISLPDRMDAVRDIARAALASTAPVAANVQKGE